MEYLSGQLDLIYDLVLSEDIKLSILNPNGAWDRDGLMRYVDLGRRRRLRVYSEPYLLWWWDGKVEWETIEPEAFEEQADGKKVFKLLPYLRALNIDARCAKKDSDDWRWKHGWEGVVTSGRATVSQEGFIFSRSNWADAWEYEWYIGYAHRGLRVGGRSVLAIRTTCWVTDDIYDYAEAVSLFKGTFEKPMDFSNEEFGGKLNQIGLGGCMPWMVLQFWPDDA